MQVISSRFSAAALCVILASCGGGSTPNSSGLAGDDSDVLTGFLIAPRVSGLSVNGALSGRDGGFNYSAEQLLNIRLGQLPISSIKARPRLSLYDQTGSAEQYRFDKAGRLGRLLISLDTDGDARNGVQLSNMAVGEDEIDWRSSPSVWQTTAESLTYRLSNGANQLITAEQALDTMASQFRAETENCSTAQIDSSGFSIADPSCADRTRMDLWRESLASPQQKLESSLDGLFSDGLSAQDWWAQLQRDWEDLLLGAEETQAWLSYSLAGADVPTRQAIENSLATGGSFSAGLKAELERWRNGSGQAMVSRDKAERFLAARTIQAWLSYGFDQQALRSGYGLTATSGSEDFVVAVAQREGVATKFLRIAVVDQQVYLALQLIDALMDSQDDWVTGGSDAQLGITGDGNAESDGSSSGQGNDPARVWRVSYGDLDVDTAIEFSVEGSGLTSDLSLVLNGCNNMQTLSTRADTVRFSCDLTGAAGGRTLQVIDNGDGSLLYEAIVSVVGGSNADDSEAKVTRVSPTIAQPSSNQLFSVVGQNFPVDMQFSLVGCPSPQVQFRSTSQLDVLCQLDDRTTVRVGRLENASGEEIYRFNVSPPVADEQEMRVYSVNPAAAIEAQTLEMVISGSGFGDTIEVQSSACASTNIVSSSDAEIRFSCRNAQLGTWPLNVVSPQQTVQVPQSLQVRALEATVTSVSPLQGVIGEWVNLKVNGQTLSEGVELELSACSDLETLDGTAVSRQFGCTPDTLGIHKGRVLAAGKVLYNFDFNVEAKPSSSASQVTPATSPYGEPLALRITGVNLPELAQLSLPGCANIALLSASSSEMRFSCTPQQVGVLSGELVDTEQGYLLSFKVDILDGRDPLDGVVLDSVSPEITYLEAQTTFTVRGENLPATLVLSVDGCSDVQTLGGTDRQRQFRCTPKGSSGQRQVSIYASDGGALIGHSDLQVTGNELLVSDVSPGQTAIGVQTIFRVSGQNLSSAVVMQLEGCDARSLAAASAEIRSYRCVPYGLPGDRTLRVLDRSGGSILFSRTIEMLASP